MITWSPILHFYQPISSDAATVQQVLNSCYLPVLDLFLNNRDAKATFHVSSSLTLVFESLGITTFAEKIQDLLMRGQIELIHSPVYHPIVPLIPSEVIERQLNQSKEIIEYFYHTNGSNILFLPELAIDEKTISHVSRLFDYTLIDQTSIEPNYPENLFSKRQLVSIDNSTFIVNNRMMTAIFRAYPTWVNQNTLVSYIKKYNPDNIPVIHANDVEVFGHHYEERIHLLNELILHSEVNMQKLTDSIKDLPVLPVNKITPSSWQTFQEDINNGLPFPMWDIPNNAFQKDYYELLRFAHEKLQQIPRPEHDSGLVYYSAEKHFDIGTASCYAYWLSNEPWWHPELAEMGATHLIKTIRTLPLTNEAKLHAEKLYNKFSKSIWEYQWSGNVEKQYSLFQNKRSKILEILPDLS